MKKTLIVMSFTLLAACGGDTMPVVKLPEIDTSNPLLVEEWDTPRQTPPFSRIETKHYAPAFETAIAVVRAEIEAIVNNPAKPTFRNTIVPLERQGVLLNRISGLFFNLLEADTSEEMQQIALDMQPALTELQNDIALDPELFARVKAVYEHPGFGLSKEDRKLLEETYRSFARQGAALSDEDKELYRKYTSEEAELMLRFGQNVLAATNAFTLDIDDASKVAELPEFLREELAAEARSRGRKGWTVTLHAPSYMPFLTYSSDRALKERLWRANYTRCVGGEYDNTEIVKRIAELRLRIANLLGHESYADYVLEDRMAERAATVNDFLADLLDRTRDYAVRDYETVNAYADSLGLEGRIMPWDWAYYSEKYKNQRYAVNDELVKPYFKLENVVKGVFLLANKLYGIEFTPAKEIDVYHPDVTAYEVTDADGRFLAVLYLDFFPRPSKRAGAWMTEFRGTYRVGDREVRPLVSLVMNFTKPTDTKPSLLTFDEVTTFLHEFGHSLHGIFAQGEYLSLNGTNVKHDFVELPSQIMENWAFEPEMLRQYATHYLTGEVIPDELVEKLRNSQYFNQGFGTTELLAASLTDLRLHDEHDYAPFDVNEYEKGVTASLGLIPQIEPRYRYTYFSHIFDGGYSAGYYFYTWAAVLDKDAFQAFKESGDLFNRKVAADFRSKVLERGGSEPGMTMYRNFRGADPDKTALLKARGLWQEPAKETPAAE